MKKAKRIERAVLIALVLVVLPSVVGAQCKDSADNVVFSTPQLDDVVLTDNIICDAKGGITSGITVGRDGITIDLNGKTLSCVDNGLFQGECQDLPVAGIKVEGFTNVTIKGPGTITGFDRSIVLVNVGKATVQGLTITGPPTNQGPLSPSSGPNTTGIYVSGAQCPGAIVLDGNDVSNHRYGIVLEQSSCVKVQANDIHDNRGLDIGSHGLLLVDSGDNTITNNQVKENGLNNAELDGGITLTGALSTGNRIAQNTVQSNCGDGISARGGAQGNPVGGNYAHSNPPEGNSVGKCLNALATYDMVERKVFGLNTWRKNNDCDKGHQIPDGVCTTTLP